MERQYDDYADYMDRRDELAESQSINIIVDGKEVWVNAVVFIDGKGEWKGVQYSSYPFKAKYIFTAGYNLAIALVNSFDEATA